MKTNGLRNKKPQCARAAGRSNKVAIAWFFDLPTGNAIDRWHRATWRKS